MQWLMLVALLALIGGRPAPAQPPGRPDLGYDVRSGIQQRNLPRALGR